MNEMNLTWMSKKENTTINFPTRHNSFKKRYNLFICFFFRFVSLFVCVRATRLRPVNINPYDVPWALQVFEPSNYIPKQM